MDNDSAGYENVIKIDKQCHKINRGEYRKEVNFNMDLHMTGKQLQSLYIPIFFFLCYYFYRWQFSAIIIIIDTHINTKPNLSDALTYAACHWFVNANTFSKIHFMICIKNERKKLTTNCMERKQPYSRLSLISFRFIIIL